MSRHCASWPTNVTDAPDVGCGSHASYLPPRLQLFRHACRRYAETWDAEKMRAERAAREGQHSAQQAQRHEAEGPTLVEEFGEGRGLTCCGAAAAVDECARSKGPKAFSPLKTDLRPPPVPPPVPAHDRSGSGQGRQPGPHAFPVKRLCQPGSGLQECCAAVCGGVQAGLQAGDDTRGAAGGGITNGGGTSAGRNGGS